MNWFRLYTDITGDRKIRRLAPCHRWLWIAMMVMARKSPEPPRLLLSEGLAVGIEDLADEAAITEDEVRAGLTAFEELGMIHVDGGVYVLTNWNKRQYASDNVTARTRTFRERHDNVDETLQERSRNVPTAVPGTHQKQKQRTDLEQVSHETCGDRATGAPTPKSKTVAATADGWREDQIIWARFRDGLGWEPNRSAGSERGGWNKAIASLRKQGVKPDDVLELVARYRERWPNVECSPMAIEANLERIRSAPLPRPKKPPNGNRAVDRSTLATMSETDVDEILAHMKSNGKEGNGESDRLRSAPGAGGAARESTGPGSEDARAPPD